MFRSRAKRSKGKCHFPGTPPRRSHMKMAFSVSSGNVSESTERPPNRSIMEATSDMGGDTGTGSSENQELFVLISRNVWFSLVAWGQQRRNTLAVSNSLTTKQAWKKHVAARVFELIADMGMNVPDFAKSHWQDIGFSNYDAAKEALTNKGQLDPYYAGLFAVAFEIDPAYVLCYRDDLDNCFKPRGKYGILRENAELKQQLAARSESVQN